MPEQPKPLLEQALDLVLYAPVGLVLTATEELPELIQKGRTRVGGEISNARVLGRYAIARGQRRAGDWVRQVAGDGQREPGPSRASPEHPRTEHAGPTGQLLHREGPAPDPSELAIPGYDSLSASQVVQRLAGLSADELAAVGDYELATRHRKTILNRVAQLSSER